jgi:WD40 repeat protein
MRAPARPLPTLVCPVTVNGRTLLASGSDDGAVRVWDPETGQQRAVLEGHQGSVRADLTLGAIAKLQARRWMLR